VCYNGVRISEVLPYLSNCYCSMLYSVILFQSVFICSVYNYYIVIYVLEEASLKTGTDPVPRNAVC
jgi:hypothetical protein